MPLKKLLFIDSFKYIAAAAAVSAKATQIFHVLNSVSGLFSRLPASMNTKPSAPRKINVGTCPAGMNRSAMKSKPPPIPHASFLGNVYINSTAHTPQTLPAKTSPRRCCSGKSASTAALPQSIRNEAQNAYTESQRTQKTDTEQARFSPYAKNNCRRIFPAIYRRP